MNPIMNRAHFVSIESLAFAELHIVYCTLPIRVHNTDFNLNIIVMHIRFR